MLQEKIPGEAFLGHGEGQGVYMGAGVPGNLV